MGNQLFVVSAAAWRPAGHPSDFSGGDTNQQDIIISVSVGGLYLGATMTSDWGGWGWGGDKRFIHWLLPLRYPCGFQEVLRPHPLAKIHSLTRVKTQTFT